MPICLSSVGNCDDFALISLNLFLGFLFWV
jgi:hypothetical protein